MIYFITILLLLSIGVNWFLITKSVALMDVVDELQTYNELRTNDIQQLLTRMLERMRAIDSAGLFESDDEVGSVFTQLKEVIEYYNTLLSDDVD
jgi:hypothetical protein